jgi:hypothetical protein
MRNDSQNSALCKPLDLPIHEQLVLNGHLWALQLRELKFGIGLLDETKSTSHKFAVAIFIS